MENDSLLSDHYLRGLGGTLVAAGALFAFFAQPILRFVSPLDLVMGGAALASAIVALWTRLVSASSDRQIMLSLIAAPILMMAFFLVVIYPAVGRAEDHDRRCRAIERHMFSDSAESERMPAIFAALQCRPQPEAV